MEKDIYRGIFYSVSHLALRRWKWEIAPPQSVKGLRPVSGEVEGAALDAVAAAHSAIDSQVGQHTG